MKSLGASWRAGEGVRLARRSGERLPVLVVYVLGILLTCSAVLGDGILEIRNGYFWDPVPGDYFIARGFAYQTFNPPVGADQSLAQLEYDLTEFKKIHANSARVEMVWNQIESPQGVFNWTKADFLVSKAGDLGIRLFVLVGFNYAPSWFPGEWTGTNGSGGGSVVVNYEHPQARHAYSNFVFQVARRYQDNPTIGAWILGNEYAYFDLWNTNRQFLGYDTISQASFRNYLASTYSNNIALLNNNWGASFASFDDVVMPTNYPANRNDPGYFDLIQWRKKSVGDYVAVGAVAARKADTRHLLTYSMVGGVFSGFDELNTCEDAKTIVARCAAAGAPLSFWSVNNYAIAALGSDLRTADFGIAKYQAQSSLPVLVTETGHSSTDNLNPEESQRYARALPTQVWEALISGALGVHLFTWNDRPPDKFAGPFVRERGFGIVNQDRTPKGAVYTNVVETFRRTENLNLPLLLGGSTNPPPDIQYFWSRNSDLVWPSANLENAQLWGALKRLGYQPGIIDDEQFEAGAATNAPALFLSRCWMMDPGHLDYLATHVIPAGVHVHANADLPGQFNPYHLANPNWAARMSSLFGLNVAQATPGLDSRVTNVTFGVLFFTNQNKLGPFSPAYSDQILTWKLWHGIPTNSATVVSDTGLNGTKSTLPALQLTNLGSAKTAVNTFALGDIENGKPSDKLQHKWDFRYTWLGAIYRDHFGIEPRIKLTGTNATHVFPDYRTCPNGSILIGLLNGDTNSASVKLTATKLIAGMTVENLTTGGIVELNSDGVVQLDMSGDEYALLYAYKSANGVDASLLNSSPNKLWITDAPIAVWPTGSNWTLSVGYELRDPNLTLMASFERVMAPNLVFAQTTNALPISVRGFATIPLSIPDADTGNPWYISSPDGGEYLFHAWLLKNGSAIAHTYLPVRLLWPVRPTALPEVVVPGKTYQITVEWQELPSWLPSEGSAPVDRAPLWQPYLASQQYYKVVLELRSDGQVIATQEFLTNTGTDQHTFTMAVPSGAAGKLTWSAHLQTVPGASIDMVDSFEDRVTGADSALPKTDPALFAPWELLTYPENVNLYFDSGVGAGGADGSQSVFIVVTNPPTAGASSGAFLFYTYPEVWALPRDRSQWTNYTFSFDLKETNGLSCVLEMQLKDTRGGLINYTKAYTPGASGWDTIKASLDQFTGPSWLGHFDSENVSQLVVLVQLLQTNVMYLISLDNVQFVGPKRAAQTVAPLDLWDGFDDRTAATGAGGWAALDPWSPYLYPSISANDFDRGVALFQGINGGQAAFIVVTNPATVGANSGFGLYRPFTNSWSLPADTHAWSNYVFSYSFREAVWRNCSIEMQVKSGDNNWIEFKKTYTPRPDGWDTVRASLDQFEQPAGVGRFDPTHVQGIALNVRMLEKKVTYVGFFDDVYFDAPDTIVPTGTSFGYYQSGNDSVADDTPVIQSIQLDGDGQKVLSWMARSNRLYSVEYQDGGLNFAEPFLPLTPLTGLTVPNDGLLQATDTNAMLSSARFYRVRVQPQ